LIYDAKFTFGPRPTIKFDFWPFVGKSLGTPFVSLFFHSVIPPFLLLHTFIATQSLLLMNPKMRNITTNN